MNLMSFVNLMNMSIKGSFVILAVLIIRMILIKRSAKERMILWVLVALRLVIPVSFSHSVSAVPRQVMHIGETAIGAAIESAGRVESGGSDTGIVIFGVVILLYIIGIALMMTYFGISIFRLKRRLGESTMIHPEVWACDRIGTPFIFGFLRPRIYVPSFLTEEDLEYVISHEKTHIRRHDHWWKPVAFVVLALHWFNPLVWAAYFAFGKDVELACDEASTCWRNREERKAYANALINCSSERSVGICPIAFGGGDIKRRVNAILRHTTQKILITILLCVVVFQFFCTEPTDKIYDHYGLGGEIYATVTKRFREEEMNYTPGKMKWPFVDMRELGYEENGDTVTVYMWILYELYYYDDGDVVRAFSQRDAVRITAEDTGDGGYRITEYLVPRDEQYSEAFPLSVRSRVIYFDTLKEDQESSCYYDAATTIIPLYKKALSDDYSYMEYN